MTNMLAHIGFLLIVFATVKPNEYNNELGYKNIPLEGVKFGWTQHNSHVNKRQALLNPQNSVHSDPIKTQGSEIVQEGNLNVSQKNISQSNQNDKQNENIPQNKDAASQSPVTANSTVQSETNFQTKNNKTELPKETAASNASTEIASSAIKSEISTAKPTDSVNILPLNSPGVVKRGLIVFGGFALLAVAYFIFYRRKGKNYDNNNTHNNNDTNQFRYGVLQSDEGRDNLELSRIPLTMESDEDEEDDLEIFDLEQKKKSLSYVNLQTNDEDIVFHNRKDESKNNLLLDIEDGPSDMINWSSSGNKSIL